MKKTKYIDLISDYGFKRVFSSEPNKDLLIDFINALFKGRKTIVDLVYDKNESVGDTDELGTVILDLLCTGDKGEKFVVEVQTSPQFNFKRRMLYYGSKLIADQAPKGNRRDWNYQISEVYVIVLMDGFRFSGSGGRSHVLHDICLCYRDTGKVFYEDMGYMFIELVNFTKREDELDSNLDAWLFVLKNMSRLDKIPLYLRKPVFQKLFRIAEYSRLNKEEKKMYDISLKRKWDAHGALTYAEEKGRKEGREEGMQKGREEEKRASAQRMLEKGFEAGEISDILGLPVEEIEKLKNT